MCDINFTVVITTYNRSKLLTRAINSIRNSKYPSDKVEIIVIDDCSPIKPEVSDDIRLIIKENNSGPCTSRNIGISLASNEWVLCLDDDDELYKESFSIVSDAINQDKLNMFPVAFFLRSAERVENREKTNPVQFFDGVGYLKNCSGKEFVPVINKKLFEKAYAFPNYKVGGESVLWLSIAEAEMIPTYFENIGVLNSDATDRLTGKKTKIRYPEQYFLIHERLLKCYSGLFKKVGFLFFCKRMINLLLYGLLSGDTRQAYISIWSGKDDFSKFLSLVLMPIAYMAYMYVNLNVSEDNE